MRRHQGIGLVAYVSLSAFECDGAECLHSEVSEELTTLLLLNSQIVIQLKLSDYVNFLFKQLLTHMDSVESQLLSCTNLLTIAVKITLNRGRSDRCKIHCM